MTSGTQRVYERETSATPPRCSRQRFNSLRAKRFESTQSVFVLEEAGARRGAVPLAELFVATRDTRLNALMQRRPPCVSAGSDHETAGSLAIRGELAVVAAVDDAGRFLGVLPPCEIVRVTLAPI